MNKTVVYKYTQKLFIYYIVKIKCVYFTNPEGV